jgi:hypothetical protein
MPSSSPPASPATPATGQRVVIDLAGQRRWREAERRDATVNAAWDGLIVLARDAWNWRDPESLAQLEAHIAALKYETLADWDD